MISRSPHDRIRRLPDHSLIGMPKEDTPSTRVHDPEARAVRIGRGFASRHRLGDRAERRFVEALLALYPSRQREEESQGPDRGARRGGPRAAGRRRGRGTQGTRGGVPPETACGRLGGNARRVYASVASGVNRRVRSRVRRRAARSRGRDPGRGFRSAVRVRASPIGARLRGSGRGFRRSRPVPRGRRGGMALVSATSEARPRSESSPAAPRSARPWRGKACGACCSAARSSRCAARGGGGAPARMIHEGRAGRTRIWRLPATAPRREARCRLDRGVPGEDAAPRSRSEEEAVAKGHCDDERRRDRRRGPPGTASFVNQAG